MRKRLHISLSKPDKTLFLTSSDELYVVVEAANQETLSEFLFINTFISFSYKTTHDFTEFFQV